MRRRRLCAAALLLAGSFVATATTARAAGCPALDYQAGLAAASSDLQRTPVDVAGAMQRVTALLVADRGSALALQPVVDDLSTSPPQLDDARLRLSSMSATLAYPPGSVCNENGDAASGALHHVYASPDFRHLDDVSQTGLLAGILNFLRDLFGSLAGGLGRLGTALLALAVVGAALALAWRRWHGSAALPGATYDEPEGTGDDPDVEWAAAQRAAGSGEYREAIRRAFRAALLEVAVRGRLHIDPTWTTRELLQRSQADGDVLVALAAAAALFDHAWYGGVAVTRDDWIAAEERCAAVRGVARRAKVAAR
jgi:hypothetical protein